MQEIRSYYNIPYHVKIRFPSVADQISKPAPKEVGIYTASL